MLEHGHTQARDYPVGMVWDEAEIVVERVNGLEATRAIFIQLAAASVMSKKAAGEFSKQIKRLTGNGE